MRLIIAGSREMPHSSARPFINAAMVTLGRPRAVLSGACKTGVDRAGEDWAAAHRVPVDCYTADWELDGKAAGPIRNACMVANADALLVIRYPDSKGSADVLRKARAAGLRVVDICLPRTP